MQTTRATLTANGKALGEVHAIRITQVPTLRACALCLHSAGHQTAPELMCGSPDVIACHGTATTCCQARASGAACGPDARHMDMAAWQHHRSAIALACGASQHTSPQP